MATKKDYRPVIFLDTNSVHSATIALAFATRNKLDLFADEWADLESRLRGHKVGKGAVGYYKNGYFIVRYLRAKSNAKAALYYSPITRLELLCGALRGKAIKKAASARVPNRWYSSMEETEIRDQLEPAGYGRVTAELADIEDQFVRAGITLNEQEAGFEVWQAARLILENVFVSVQDCIVYASAFQLQATELITSDRYLGELTTFARQPASAGELAGRFRTLNKSLVGWYARENGWPVKDITLPERRTIKEITNAAGGS